MNLPFETILIIISSLLLLCVIISKVSDRLGVPILLLFLGIGMLAGSEGLGGIYFDNSLVTQYIANSCLALILFASGLDTSWKSIRSVAREGIALATIGVLLTAGIFGIITHQFLKLTWLESLLLGAIISSTDAAAVFSILRSKGLNLKSRLAPLLELESGSNDPIAVILTVSLISLITAPGTSILSLICLFFLQIIVGFTFAWIFSSLSLFLINRLKLGYDGLYPVLAIALVFLAFSLTTVLKGSGFLAVYLFGLLLGRNDFLHHHSLARFFDTSAWISQIVLFLTLGLLVFPSHLAAVALPALLLAFALVFIVRPLAVFITLLPFHYSWREKTFIAWVGLRGAVPIVLGTYPLVAGIQNASLIFNIVFFVVITSVLMQGTLLPRMAKWLKVKSDTPLPLPSPFELTARAGLNSQMMQTTIPADANCVGKAIYELALPAGYLVILINRGNTYIQPNGSTLLQAGDIIHALAAEDSIVPAREILTQPLKTDPAA
jgi:potassium/hydrogen antiporter